MSWSAGAVLGALQELWPVLAGLTLLEGVTWVPSRDRRARSLLGGGLRLVGPGLRWSALGPLDRCYSLPPEPALLGPERVHFAIAPDLGGARRFRPDHYRSFPYAELGELVRGLDPHAARMALPDGSSLPLPAAAVGRDLCERIARTAALAPSARPRVLAAEAQARLDEQALAARHRSLGVHLPVLRTLAATAFTACLVAPFLLYKAGVPAVLAWPLAGGFLALHAATATAATRLRSVLRREGLPVPRGALLGVWLYPPATFRAVASLTRELAAGLDPLAVLATEGAPGELDTLLAAELYGTESALAAPDGEADWRAAWQWRSEALEAFLARRGRDRRAALGPPGREDPAASHYCPFCAGEFRPGPEECPSCRGPLAAFPQPPTGTGTKQARRRRSRPRL